MSDFSCDQCRNKSAPVIFRTKEDLEAHIKNKHADDCPEFEAFEEAGLKIKDNWNMLADRLDERYIMFGEKAFLSSSVRDSGPEKLQEACNARKQLECIVNRWYKGSSVFIFGSSIVMGFWDGISDIDFTVVAVDAYKKGQWHPNERSAVRSITELLRRCGFLSENLEPVTGARVPIIKQNASVAPFRFLSKKQAEPVARSVRFLFEPAVNLDDRRCFEQTITELLGPDAVEQVWWESGHRVVGVTLDNSTNAIRALLHQPAMKDSNLVKCAPMHEEFRPELYQLDFDLSFRQFGIRNSRLLRDSLQSHPCGRPGAIILKDWSKTSGVNNSMNGYFTSYAINILWIFYLVQNGTISYINPQDIPDQLEDGVDCEPTYRPLIPPGMTEAERSALYTQMGKLIIGFFAYYCFVFDWEKDVVSLNRPDVTTKEQLGWMPSSSGKVKYHLCIEDPYEENLNLGRHIGNVRKRVVLTEFRRALVSLLRDEKDATCVFQKSDDASTKKESVPVESVLRLMQISLELIEGSTTEEDAIVEGGAAREASISAKELKDAFTNEAPMEFALVSKLWTWPQIVYRLGYKAVGDKIVPRNPVSGAAQRQTLTEEEMKLLNDLNADVASTLIKNEAKESIKPPSPASAEWVMWTPPGSEFMTNSNAQQLGGNGQPVGQGTAVKCCGLHRDVFSPPVAAASGFASVGAVAPQRAALTAKNAAKRAVSMAIRSRFA